MLPGFVDAHTHPVFAGNARRRVRASRARAPRTPRSRRAAAASARPSAAPARPPKTSWPAAARRYRSWFLRGGTTTVEAKSGYGLSLEAELKILRVIRELGAKAACATSRPFSARTRSPTNSAAARTSTSPLLIHEMLPRVAAERLAEYCDIFCEPTVFPRRAGARDPARPRRRAGSASASTPTSSRPTTARIVAAELGAATADHLEATTDAGLRALHAAGVQPVLLPASVYALGLTRYPAARRMIELGMPVVLATDFNPGSSPTASMPMVLSLASTQMKMTPAEAITAATINAAYSLGRGAEIGSLEPGKRADFVIHDCDDYREIPYFFGRETARDGLYRRRPASVIMRGMSISR